MGKISHDIYKKFSALKIKITTPLQNDSFLIYPERTDESSMSTNLLIFHRFHSCSVGDEGTARISQLLTSTASIASLDLVDCKVGCAGIAALGVALMQNTSLKSLK